MMALASRTVRLNAFFFRFNGDWDCRDLEALVLGLLWLVRLQNKIGEFWSLVSPRKGVWSSSSLS